MSDEHEIQSIALNCGSRLVWRLLSFLEWTDVTQSIHEVTKGGEKLLVDVWQVQEVCQRGDWVLRQFTKSHGTAALLLWIFRQQELVNEKIKLLDDILNKQLNVSDSNDRLFGSQWKLILSFLVHFFALVLLLSGQIVVLFWLLSHYLDDDC